MIKRRTRIPEFKARVAMEAISGCKIIKEIGAANSVHPVQVSQWKRQLLYGVSENYSPGARKQRARRKGRSRREWPANLFSRNMLSWELSNCLGTEFCLDAPEMAV